MLGYTRLPESLVDMFRATVDAHPDGEALVTVRGGESRHLWDRSEVRKVAEWGEPLR